MNNNIIIYFFKIIRLATDTMLRQMGRTLLTLLGIIVSIMAIMLVMAMGANVEKYVEDEITAFGTDTIQVEISVPDTDHVSTENATSIAMGVEITSLTDKDAEAIEKLPHVEAVNVGVIGQKRLAYDGNHLHATLLGAGADTLIVDPAAKIARGRYFNKAEVDTAANVIAMGSEIAKDVFENESPVGKRVRIGTTTFRVVGTFEERGSAFGISYDDFVYIPYTTLQKQILGTDHVQFITVKSDGQDHLEATAKDIEAILRSRHDITDPNDDDFAVTTIKEAQDMIGEILGMMTILLVALASVSVIVGGVGIMNMMLMSVEERKREIGLRKALGARPHDILYQFLTEAVVISLFAALIGITLSVIILYVASYSINASGFEINLVIPMSAIFASVGFSFAAGIIFGVYPARTAARIHPISAMNG